MRRANLTVPEKLKMQREGYKFFCERHEIDRCAIGEDIGFTCFRASKHKTREGCQYWKPVHIKREDEITRLRADLAAVTAERDRMREVIKSINAMLEISCETLERPTYNSLEVGQRHSPPSQKEIIQRFTETCSFVRADLLRTMDEARAAIEGVKEPEQSEGGK